MLDFVDSLEEVIENVQEYQSAVHHSRRARPAGVWHWYYLPPPIDQAGPSRFIGYKNMTAERYDYEPVHGTETQHALARLKCFVEVRLGHRYYEGAYRAATRLLEHGKTLQSNAKFYTPGEETAAQIEQFRGEADRRKYGLGGEGQDHKALKLWCCENPEFFGLGKPRNIWCDEFTFPSGDRPDLVLEFDDGSFAVVEIETRYPFPGAYQVIKYKALLAARKGLPIGTTDITGCLVAWHFKQDVKDFANKYGINTYTKIL